MQFIDILRKDIKELDAKKIGITYELDMPLDTSKGSSVLDPDCVFCCDFYSCRVTRFAGQSPKRNDTEIWIRFYL